MRPKSGGYPAAIEEWVHCTIYPVYFADRMRFEHVLHTGAAHYSTNLFLGKLTLRTLVPIPIAFLREDMLAARIREVTALAAGTDLSLATRRPERTAA